MIQSLPEDDHLPVCYEQIKSAVGDLYDRALRKVPEDTLDALRKAHDRESSAVAQSILQVQLRSAELAATRDQFVCSDAGVPVYTVRIGSKVAFDGDVKRAFADGFDELVARIDPPLLKHVANPLTNERSYRGKDMPLVTWDVVDGADYLEIICQPKALGSGRWAELQIFSYPTLEQIEQFVMDVVLRAGSQHCPPVIIGVGIGGDFDVAAKLAKQSTLRKIGSINPEPILAAMEQRLLDAVNATGFGPMGTGGDTTALAVHCDYAAGHGYTPVAVAFNCWINRRTSARLHVDGRTEITE